MTPEELLAEVAQPPPGRLIVAVSGGPDSAIAVWAVKQLAPGMVEGVHIHHGTAAADSLAAAAAKVCEIVGVPLTVIPVDVPAGPSWEDQARHVRWEALERARPGDGTIITGHHLDDLAETTFAHLIRGAGSAGLAAMAVPRQSVWRPLLGLRRADIEDVAVRLGLPFAVDPANSDLAHTRNRLRHEVLPRLADELNPELAPSLARTASFLAADDSLIESIAGDVPIRRDSWGAWRIPCALITTAEPAISVRLIRRLLRAARPPYAGNATEIAIAFDVAGGVTGRRQISDGWELELEGPWLVMHRGAAPEPSPESLPVPGAVRLGPLVVSAVAAPQVLIRRASLVTRSAVGHTVTIRAAAVGERIEIEAGSKLIRDVMGEADIPRRLRSAWPIAESGGRIAAIAGIRSAPWARGTAGAEDVYELTVGEAE